MNLEKYETREGSNNDLMEINGGIDVGTGTLIVGGCIFIAGVFVGYAEAEKGK